MPFSPDVYRRSLCTWMNSMSHFGRSDSGSKCSITKGIFLRTIFFATADRIATDLVAAALISSSTRQRRAFIYVASKNGPHVTPLNRLAVYEPSFHITCQGNLNRIVNSAVANRHRMISVLFQGISKVSSLFGWNNERGFLHLTYWWRVGFDRRIMNRYLCPLWKETFHGHLNKAEVKNTPRVYFLS